MSNYFEFNEFDNINCDDLNNELEFNEDFVLEIKSSSMSLEKSCAYVNRFYVEEFMGGVIEDAWLYHKNVQNLMHVL